MSLFFSWPNQLITFTKKKIHDGRGVLEIVSQSVKNNRLLTGTWRTQNHSATHVIYELANLIIANLMVLCTLQKLLKSGQLLNLIC